MRKYIVCLYCIFLFNFVLQVDYVLSADIQEHEFVRLEKEAERGDVDSQYRLGLIYYNGDGVSQSNQKAFEWVMKSANKGNAKAQYVIGRMYHHGHGVNKDIDEAIIWYTKSAKQGAAPVQYMLGLIYYHGNYVGKDDTTAKYWFKKAADQGMNEAKVALEKVNDQANRVYPYMKIFSAKTK